MVNGGGGGLYQGARSGSELIAVTLASDRKAFRLCGGFSVNWSVRWKKRRTSPCRRTCVSACARELAGDLVDRPVPGRDEAADADRLLGDHRRAAVLLELLSLENLDRGGPRVEPEGLFPGFAGLFTRLLASANLGFLGGRRPSPRQRFRQGRRRTHPRGAGASRHRGRHHLISMLTTSTLASPAPSVAAISRRPMIARPSPVMSPGSGWPRSSFSSFRNGGLTCRRS